MEKGPGADSHRSHCQPPIKDEMSVRPSDLSTATVAIGWMKAPSRAPTLKE